MEQIQNKKIMLVSALLVLCTAQAMAFTNNAGGIGADFYTVAADFATGYVGKTIALGGVAAGLFMLFRGMILPAVGCAIASVGFAKSQSIVDSMGFIS